MPRRESIRYVAPDSPMAHGLTELAPAGEALSFDAGTYPQGSSGPLHLEAARHRGELRPDDQQSPFREASRVNGTGRCARRSVEAIRKINPGIVFRTASDLSSVYGHERNSFQGDDSSSPATPRHSDDYGAGSLLPAASAAAALAQLHHHNLESEREPELVGADAAGTQPSTDGSKETLSDDEVHNRPKIKPIELPGIAQMKQEAGILMPPYDPTRPRQLLPSLLSKSPPGRSSTLPPIQRRQKQNRPQKSSVTQNARKSQHERKRSRGGQMRRVSYDGRKAFSAEPSGIAPIMGKRWEDLIDAATSANEEVDSDRTPVRARIRPRWILF